MIQALPIALNVYQAQRELEGCTAWNLLRMRTDPKNSPHRECDDIWMRYRSGELRPDGSFDCSWYDVADELPAVVDLCNAVEALTGATEIGGVLVTRIPPGKQVYPHKDFGWHAEYFEKYAVQIRGNAKQKFSFEDCHLVTETGDLFTFVNQHGHWVTNDSDEPRITLIVCLKRAH